jgi:predicted membrane-bound spermidine synthase
MSKQVETTPHPAYLIAVAFFSGMAIMGVEMSSSRLLAPFFGTSISVWTAIIGSTMIALTAGYYLGGVIAERRPRLEFLGKLLFLAAVFVVFLPYLAQPLMEIALARFSGDPATASSGGNALLVALIVCAALICVPVAVLGMTSPFLIRLDSLRSPEVGRISGKIFAFSTLGSIVGTFLPALVLVPNVGTRFSFLFFGGTLLCVIVWSVKQARSLLLILGMITLATGFLLGIRGWSGNLGPYLLHEVETLYQYVRIYRVPIPGKNAGNGAQATFILTDAGMGMQSMWVDGQPNTDSWQDFFPVVPRIYETSSGSAPQRILVLGLGGACAPYLISQFYPRAAIDGVEIDRGLIQAALPYFPYFAAGDLNVHVSDARFFLKTCVKRYDVIIVDVFRPPHIPSHLASVEFFEEAREHLTEYGVIGMNVGSRGEHKVFHGIANTVAAVFPHVYFARHHLDDGRALFTNRFIIASNRNLGLEQAEIEQRLFSVCNHIWRDVWERMRDPRGFEAGQNSFFRKVAFDPHQLCFTDDSSSLEMVSEREFFGLIFGRRR